MEPVAVSPLAQRIESRNTSVLPCGQPTSLPAIQNMETLNDLRKAIKPLGYKVRIKNLSWGPHATYIHADSGDECTANVFTAETLAKWLPLFTWIKANAEPLRLLREKTGTVGLLASILKT